MNEIDYNEVKVNSDRHVEDESAKEAVGKLLDLSDTIHGDGTRISDDGKPAESKHERINIKELLEGEFQKIRISPEAFLSRTERMLLNNLSTAIKDGDLSSVQEGLAALAENPNSVKAVMACIKERMENANLNNSVKWETGHDSNGQAFVRMHITHKNKPGLYTNVMIGSDGTHSASRTDVISSSFSTALDPASALKDVTSVPRRRFPVDQIIIPDTIYKHSREIKK